MCPWELARALHRGHILTSIFFLVALVGHTYSNPAKDAAMAHMQQTFFRLIAESNAVLVFSSFFLLAILVTRFKIVELDGSLHLRFRKGGV